MSPLETRDLARRLLTDEAAADKTSVSTESTGFRVYEKLRHHLCAFAGVAVFHSLAYRALTLAKAKASSLYAMQVAADGSLQKLAKLRRKTTSARLAKAESFWFPNYSDYFMHSLAKR